MKYINWRSLTEPFHHTEVKWRVGSTSRDKSKGIALAYVDARAVMDRLDFVLGAENWSDEYTETPTNRIICKLSINTPQGWITKSDGAGATTFEGEKGAISDAFKRAAVKFGIGRYLYELPTEWIELDNGRVARTPNIQKLVPNKKFNSAYYYGMAVQNNFNSIYDIKTFLAQGEIDRAAEAWYELSEEDQISIYSKAPTLGGVFTIEERKQIDSQEFNSSTFARAKKESS